MAILSVDTMEQSLLLVNFKGQILSMTQEEYAKFLDTIEEWDN